MNNTKVVDLFAGTGAFSYIFEKNNCKSVFANDMMESSKEIYELNNSSEDGNSAFILGDLNDISVESIPKHDILCGGFPCFVAGTQTLTNNGYKNIENVLLTDKLLTHTGEFHKILNLQTKTYTEDLYEIQTMQSLPMIVTKDHPYYIRTVTEYPMKESNNIAEWKNVDKLTMNDYFGMVINTKKIVPTVKHMGEEIRLNHKNYWLVLGYILGNNWTTQLSTKKVNKNIVNINSGREIITQHINREFDILQKDNGIWYDIILNQFNNKESRLNIPEWVHDAPKQYIQELINGFKKTETGGTGVSINIGYGIQRLYLKLGKIISIDQIINVIDEDKPINCQSFIDGDYVWYKPQKIEKIDKTEMGVGIVIQVYNFEVEKDNSYVVENVCVHNCQPFSIAGNQKGFEDSRSNVFWKILEILEYHKPSIIVLENVKNLTSHDNGNTYNTIIDNLTLLGYYVKAEILDTCVITEIPQHRERIYMVGFLLKEQHDAFDFNFPVVKTRKTIMEMLEPAVLTKYYYTEKLKVYDEVKKEVTKHIRENTLYQYRRYYIRENKSNCCPTLTANMGSGGHNVPLLMDDNGIRKLTPKECFNLQGFPKDYKLPPKMSDCALYKLAGNAVSVPVIELIIRKIAKIKNEITF